ncbi:MAG TPA: adenylyl-sulfate kinase [Desulfovibrio sp.]|nr:adenylyl-sulfate kinase [Desulfovibrio sp.]HBR06314.1 adenylyl-sulfate kinase [Desulfovibrio sp.]
MSVIQRVLPEERYARHGHVGGILWFTGLSGAGKTTLSESLERALFQQGYAVAVLDGDIMRQGISADLSFSAEDRSENLRRLAHMARLLSRIGVLCITATISPFQRDRAAIRALMAPGEFHEVYIKASLSTCEQRDPKGLYRKARQGQIKAFTGIQSPYEPPESPDVVVDTESMGVEACLNVLTEYVARHFQLGTPNRSGG